MKQDGSIALFHYWNRLRNGRAAPKRTEIEPADIKSLLADTFILEKGRSGQAIFRLAGTRLCAIYGRELKGHSFPSLWNEKDRSMIASLTDGTFTSKSVVVLSFSGISLNGRENAFELLLLPLDGGPDSPRCLGLVSAGKKPFWLGADPVIEARAEAVRVVDPDREPMLPTVRPVPSLNPDTDAVTGAGSGLACGRRIHHLVVLDGGRQL